MEKYDGSGLTPIMIGEKAVDDVTAELSTVTGVRVNPATNVVVPVTAASGIHSHRRPPLGMLALLEDEAAARRGHWRRSRQQEEELFKADHRLFDILQFESKSASVSDALAAIEELRSEIAGAAERETQRRRNAEHEYGTVLPPTVISVLTEVDEDEQRSAAALLAAHNKLIEAVRKFSKKLETEHQKYKDRLDELRDAMNPDAQSVAEQRHTQAVQRLKRELSDQVWSRCEQLYEARAVLNYRRTLADILAVEAKGRLTGTGAVMAGEYDYVMSGVYGEMNLTSSSSDQELVPLLRQMIGLLESGSAFVLSPSLVSTLATGSGHQGRIVASGAAILASADTSVSAVTSHHQVDQLQQTVDMSSHSHSAASPSKVAATGTSPFTATSGTSPARGQQMFSGGLTPSMAKVTGVAASEEALLQIEKQIFEKQAYESAALENELRREEAASMSEALEEVWRDKAKAAAQACQALKDKLKLAGLDLAARERAISENTQSTARLLEQLDVRKRQQLDKLLPELLESRRARKRELHKAHLFEAKAAGARVDRAVPAVPQLAHEELRAALQAALADQEKLLAELKCAQLTDSERREDEAFQAEAEGRLHRGLESGLDAELEGMLRSKAAEAKERIETTKTKLDQQLEKQAALSILKAGPQSGDTIGDDIRAVEQKAHSLLQKEFTLSALRELEEEALFTSEEAEIGKRAGRIAALSAVSSPVAMQEERNRILQEYRESCEAARRQREATASAQDDRLTARLAARRRVHDEMARDRAVDDELARVLSEQMDHSGSLETADVVKQLVEQSGRETLSSDMERLVEDQIQRQADIAISHKGELVVQLAALDLELHDTVQAISKDIDQQKEISLDHHKSKFEREMATMKNKMKAEDYEKVLANHKRELDALRAGLDGEKARQQQALADKIEEKRRQVTASLAEKHAIDIARELLRQKQERDALSDDLMKKLEEQILHENAAGKDGSQVSSMIYQVLRQRHLKQAVRLEDAVCRDLEASLRDAERTATDERQGQREQLVQALHQEAVEQARTAEAGKEGAAAAAELARRHERQLVQFDTLTEAMIGDVRRDTTRELDIKRTYGRLHLKERQLQELLEAMESLSPEEALTRQYKEEAVKAGEDAKAYFDNVLQRMRVNLEKLKEEKLRLAEEKKTEMERAFRQMEEEFEDERKKEEQMELERQSERQQLLLQQVKERERKVQEEISRTNMEEDERARLLKEHQENIARLEETVKKEQEKSHDALKQKLESRRARKEAAERARLAKEQQIAEEEERKMEHARKAAEETKAQASVTAVSPLLQRRASMAVEAGAAVAVTSASPARSLTKRASTAAAVPNAGLKASLDTEQDIVNILMSSPLFVQINEVYDILEKTAATGSSSTHVIGGDYSRAYIDVKDAQWVCNGGLDLVDADKMTARQFVVYRFGSFIASLLKETLDVPEIDVLIAPNLPQNNYTRNAYRNSFFYDYSKKTLFIRKERLDSVGEYVLLLVHCLAHIKVDDLTDDGNPVFLRQFYKALKTVCQDMFFSRARQPSAPVAGQLTESKSALSMEDLFSGLTASRQKESVVSQLVDMTASKQEATTTANVGKLSDYLDYTANARLRQLVTPTRGSSSSSNAPVNKRQSEQLHSHLNALQDKCDSINSELAPLLFEEMELQKRAASVADGSEQNKDIIQQRLLYICLSKESRLKELKYLENEINSKTAGTK